MYSCITFAGEVTFPTIQPVCLVLYFCIYYLTRREKIEIVGDIYPILFYFVAMLLLIFLCKPETGNGIEIYFGLLNIYIDIYNIYMKVSVMLLHLLNWYEELPQLV